MPDLKISELTNYPTPLGTDILSGVDIATNTTKKIPINDLWVALNLAEGQMINGRIAPSVASNNLTVALKGMDGNDPSATNPVYCRINGVVRSITGALSTGLISAGYNWFNAGSAELATKEIDYFVYLFWNSNKSEVEICFSRIPDAKLISDLVLNVITSEKYTYVAFSPAPASTDILVNIGRFAATLSAGAGYTWSVPTFTASNLIQEPIHENRGNVFVPAVSSSAGALTSYTTDCDYKLIGNKIFVRYKITITDNGTGSGHIDVSIPFALSNVGISVSGREIITGGKSLNGGAASTTLLAIYNYDNSYPAATNSVLCFNLTYLT
jgi:hypothetical protein